MVITKKLRFVTLTLLGIIGYLHSFAQIPSAQPLDDPGPLSAIYADQNISLRYPKNWLLKQRTARSAIIFPDGAFLTDIPGHPQYYTHGIFLSTYDLSYTETKYDFSALNEEVVASVIQANVGAEQSPIKPVTIKLAGTRATMTRLENRTAPLGLEEIFVLSVDLGNKVEVLQFFMPENDREKYMPTIIGVSMSIRLSNEPSGHPQPDGPAQHTVKIPLSPQAIAKRASGSTVMIVSTDRMQRKITLGSGFAVGPGLILTNSHVFTAGKIGAVSRVFSDKFIPINRVVSRDSEDDLVLLYVHDLDLPTLTIDATTAQIGDPVFTMGNPEGMEGTFSQGLISGLRVSKGTSLIQITAPISHGSSGGPVLNQFGEVIGISTSMLESGQNLNFAVPASAIGLFLNQAPLPLKIQ